VVPCSVLIFEETIGGLMLSCKNKDLKYIGLVPPNAPTPALKFRMLNIDNKTHAIEIHLIFDRHEIIKMHLNPVAQTTIAFFKLAVDTKKISFHFHNTQTKALSSCMTSLEEEDFQWFKRNYELIKKLNGNEDYDIICNLLIKSLVESDRLFSFYDNSKIDCFIRENQKLVKFES